MELHGKWTFSFPTLIRFGHQVISELGPCLKDQNKTSPLLVTDPVLREMAFVKNIVKDLERQGMRVVMFSDIHKNPVKSDVEAAAAVFRQEKCDSVVGVGGGASLDVARATCLAAHHPGDLFDYQDGKGDHLITKEIPFFITVPTTSGTGSEVGRSAVISDDKTREKKILFSPRLLAQRVFADPWLTMELPPQVTAATGMDAFTHNIEAFLAKGLQPLCDGIAQEGMRLVVSHLNNSVNRPDVTSRAGMMLASLMGAVAFQKGLGVVHSCAHAMSTLFDTHHGLANAVMLSYGMEFNQSVCVEKFQRLADIFGTEPKNVVPFLRDLNKRIGLPLHLRELGIKEENLADLSQKGLADFCHPSNPRPVTLKDFQEIFRKAF